MSVHKNYFTFTADSHFDLGLQFGESFREQLRNSLESLKSKLDWQENITNGKDYLPYAEEAFPHLIEELKGYATGANVDFAELWTLSLEDELSFYKKEKCTSIVTNNGKLISHNEDWSPDSQDMICVVKKTIKDLSIFELYYFNTLGGNSISINSHGFVHCINSLSHTDWQLGVPRNVVCRFMSETKNPETDFEKLKHIKRSLGYNHVLVNKDGEICDIESTSQKQELTKPGSPFAHTNHYIGNLRNLDGEKKTAENSTFNRYEQATSLVKPQMTTEELITLNSNTDQGNKMSIFNERTIAKMVVDIENKIAKVWLRRERELGWIDYSLDLF